MKKFILSILVLTLFVSFVNAQITRLESTRQNYTRGTASSKFSDTTSVIITHDFENKTCDFKYMTAKTPVYPDVKSLTFQLALDRKSTRLNSSHIQKSRMPSSA